MYTEELFPLDVAVMVGQLSYRADHGWRLTVASRAQHDGAGFGQWTTYGPMTTLELATLLDAIRLGA